MSMIFTGGTAQNFQNVHMVDYGAEIGGKNGLKDVSDMMSMLVY